MRGPSPLYIEERHRALGRDATFSWSRALTHPPRCNRTRHRGPPSWYRGAAILVSWGPPSWTGSRGGRHLGSEVVGTAILDRKWRHWRYSDAYTTATFSMQIKIWSWETYLDIICDEFVYRRVQWLHFLRVHWLCNRKLVFLNDE